MSHSVPSESLTSLFTENKTTGVFTVYSVATRKDYTYKIARREFNGKWYTHVSVEWGYLNFKYLGTYFNGKIYKKRQTVDTPAAKGIAWVLGKVEAKAFDLIDSQAKILHTGNCVRCSRKLTDALSIETGLGPTCRGLVWGPNFV